MTKAMMLALALAMPVAATAEEVKPKMDVAALEKKVRVSSQGAAGVEFTFLLMTALMFGAALSGGGTAPLKLLN